MLYIHGSPASRMFRALGKGVDVCITVTLVDGLVLARSAFHHSMNYRSVVIFGKAMVLEDPAAKREALRVFTEHVARGPMAGSPPALGEGIAGHYGFSRPAGRSFRQGAHRSSHGRRRRLRAARLGGSPTFRPHAQTPIPDDRLPREVPIPNYVTKYARRLP